jgi:hypothetical protein
MAECIKCGDYTKFNGGLCIKCYSKKESNLENIDSSVVSSTTPSGLNDKDKNYRYNMIKGRIAETLIQELFLSLDYNVFRYGMENTIPGIIELLKGVRSDVADYIKRMPDFVVQNRDTKEVFFIEVKF